MMRLNVPSWTRGVPVAAVCAAFFALDPALAAGARSHGEGVRAVAQLPALTLVSREPLRGRATPSSLGLTGVNSLSGLQGRFRQSVANGTPTYVPRVLDGMLLTIADSTPDGWVTLYRTDPVGGAPGSDPNSRFRAILFGRDGRQSWNLDLNRFLSRSTNLEVHDIRYRDGKLYFNEACQSFSRYAGGRCSSLVRVSPRTGRVDWRSRPLVSSNIFIFSGPYIVAGYGQTREPDNLYLVSQETGRVVASRPLDTAHRYLEEKGGYLYAVTHGFVYKLRVRVGG